MNKRVGILLFVSIALVSIGTLYALTMNKLDKPFKPLGEPLGDGNSLDPKFTIENSTDDVFWVNDFGDVNLTTGNLYIALPNKAICLIGNCSVNITYNGTNLIIHG